MLYMYSATADDMTYFKKECCDTIFCRHDVLSIIFLPHNVFLFNILFNVFYVLYGIIAYFLMAFL